MALFTELLERPARLSVPSKSTIANGVFYFGTGLLLMAWPGSVQTLLLEAPFVGHEAGLFRLVGLTLTLIGWFYIFGGRTGARSFVTSTVVDRLLLPFFLVPLAFAGVFPHVCLMFAVLDPLLGIGAWTLLRKPAAQMAPRTPLRAAN